MWYSWQDLYFSNKVLLNLKIDKLEFLKDLHCDLVASSMVISDSYFSLTSDAYSFLNFVFRKVFAWSILSTEFCVRKQHLRVSLKVVSDFWFPLFLMFDFLSYFLLLFCLFLCCRVKRVASLAKFGCKSSSFRRIN